MTDDDRLRWDAVYSAGAGSAGRPEDAAVPALLAAHGHLFPSSGFALEVACGRGVSSVWLASLGLEVLGVDISAVALQGARDLAAGRGLIARCRFELADLDHGLPPSPPADVVLCHMFRDRRLYRAMAERLRVGGLLAIAVLSEVGGEPGPFRAGPGELRTVFADLHVLAGAEGEGRAWLLAMK